MSRIRWGLIGCGDVARKRVAEAIIDEPNSDLVAACRRDKTQLQSFCKKFGIDQAYTDAEELLAAADIDAVYIATPVKDHLPHTVAAALAKKHVLVEKPMAKTVAECDRMIAACREADVKLGVAYYRRFYPLVHRIQHLIRGGEIGTPLCVSAVTATPLSMKPGTEGYWRVSPEVSGGGPLMDIGSHRINVFLHLFGSVKGVKSICETVAADYDAEDTALVLLKFDSGVTGTLQCHFGCRGPDEFVVTGTRGRLVATPLNGDELIVEIGAQSRLERHPPPSNLCGPLVADFASAVLEGREPTVTGEEGRATNSVIERAYSDAHQARP